MNEKLMVEVQGLSHWFGIGAMRRQVLQSISLQIAPGEVVLLSGPSGCGKTTLLTLIGALRKVQQGDVCVFGHQLRGSDRRLRQQLRCHIGMIIQGHNLLRCLTAEQNVQMGADLLPGLSYRARRDQARYWLRAVGLDDHLSKLPHDLSGGQKQRVAIGRAIVREPSIYLFDEPLSNLDAELRVATRVELKALHARLGNTMIYVTHDQVEAMTMADKIVVMNVIGVAT